MNVSGTRWKVVQFRESLEHKTEEFTSNTAQGRSLKQISAFVKRDHTNFNVFVHTSQEMLKTAAIRKLA